MWFGKEGSSTSISLALNPSITHRGSISAQSFPFHADSSPFPLILSHFIINMQIEGFPLTPKSVPDSVQLLRLNPRYRLSLSRPLPIYRQSDREVLKKIREMLGVKESVRPGTAKTSSSPKKRVSVGRMSQWIPASRKTRHPSLSLRAGETTRKSPGPLEFHSRHLVLYHPLKSRDRGTDAGPG
jgi:hypothetical protein